MYAKFCKNTYTSVHMVFVLSSCFFYMCITSHGPHMLSDLTILTHPISQIQQIANRKINRRGKMKSWQLVKKRVLIACKNCVPYFAIPTHTQSLYMQIHIQTLLFSNLDVTYIITLSIKLIFQIHFFSTYSLIFINAINLHFAIKLYVYFTQIFY